MSWLDKAWEFTIKIGRFILLVSGGFIVLYIAKKYGFIDDVKKQMKEDQEKDEDESSNYEITDVKIGKPKAGKTWDKNRHEALMKVVKK